MMAQQSAADQNSQDRSSDVRRERSNEEVSHGRFNGKDKRSEEQQVHKKDRTGKQKYYGCLLVAMKAGDQPATHCPHYERQRDSEYKGERSGQACLNKYRCPQDGPRSADWSARFNRDTEVAPKEERREERKDPCDVNNPHAPTCQKRACGDPLVSSNFLEQAYRNGFHRLTPVPHRAVFLPVLFSKVAEDRVIVGAGPKMFQHPRCNSRRLFRRHAFSPFSSGKPFHKFIRDLRASRTSRIPAPVMRK